MNKILLVGELNLHSEDPRYALYPYPEHCSGGRLKEILGLSLTDYLKGHDRVNLCTGSWNMRKACDKAQQILLEGRLTNGIAKPGFGLVLCGRKVIDAFCQPEGMPVELFEVVSFYGVPAACLPHPSGRNRVWNDPRSVERARDAYETLRRIVGHELKIVRAS